MGTWQFCRVSAAFARFDKDRSDSCSSGIHHVESRTSEQLLRCMTMILSQNILQWMSLLGRLKRDTWPFSRVGAAFARFDKDSSDSCSTGIHHAEPGNSERLIRCMAMILSQNNLQWMSLLGRIIRDTWQFSRVSAAFARFDKDRSDSCSSGIHHAEPRTSEQLLRCMTMILSQNNLQWMSLLGRINWHIWLLRLPLYAGYPRFTLKQNKEQLSRFLYVCCTPLQSNWCICWRFGCGGIGSFESVCSLCRNDVAFGPASPGLHHCVQSCRAKEKCHQYMLQEHDHGSTAIFLFLCRVDRIMCCLDSLRTSLLLRLLNSDDACHGAWCCFDGNSICNKWHFAHMPTQKESNVEETLL